MNLKKHLAVLAALTIGSFASTALAEGITVTTAEELIAAVADEKYDVITLGNDINLTAELAISRSLTLDLNGYLLRQTTSETRVLSLNNGATLTIADSNPNVEHTFRAGGDESKQDGVWKLHTGEYYGNPTHYDDLEQRPFGGDVIFVNGGAITGGSITETNVHGGGILINNGYLIINAGNIIGNKAYSGAGICCHSGSVTQNGGRVIGNALSGNDSGGGVYMQGGTYTLNGGEISFNRGNCGGGVNAGWSSQNFIMTGGKVAYNFGGQGGGVAAYHNGSLTGGVITRNIVKQDNDGQIYGAGVYFGTSLTVGGNIQISSNYLKDTSTPNNLYVDTNKNLTLSSLGASARIGITTHAVPGKSSPVTFVSSGATQSNLGNFSSDSNSYGVTYDNSKLKLSVMDYACQIFVGETEGTKYMTVQEAVNSITETGKTIKLLRDNTLTSKISIRDTIPAFTLDLNGYVLKQSGYNQRVIENSGDLTIVDSNPTTTHYLLKSGADWILQNSQPSGTEGENYVTVSGGCITGGNIPEDGGNGSLGGGIMNLGNLFLTGGNICGNKSVCGSGIWHWGNNDICSVGGNAKIKYNTTSNLGLLVYADAYVTVGTPSAGMEVGITTYNKGPEHYDPNFGRFTVYGTAASNKSYFFSDDSGYLIKYNKGSGSGSYLETVAKVNVCKNVQTSKEYETLAAAIAEVATGQTIQLIADVTECISTSGTFTLDLNDHILKADSNDRVINVGGNLTIVDNSAEKTTRYFSKKQGVWSLTDEMTEYSVSGGCITGGNTSGNGGGINLSGSSLTLLGGNICGNTASAGSGIYVTNNPAFTIGGTAVVKYNSGMNVALIHESQNNTLTIGSGEQAPKSGMEIGISTLDKSNQPSTGMFTSNGAESDAQYFFADKPESFQVAYNAGTGEGAYLELVEVTVNYVCQNVQTSKMYETLADAIAEVTTNQTIQLLKNISLSSAIDIVSGKESIKEFTLDLNGYVLHQTATGARVLNISGGILKVTDSSAGSLAHYYSYNDSSKKWSLSDETTANVVYGGCISGGNVTGNGGGILVADEGILDFRSGTIAYNSAANGGGVYDSFKPSFFGGTISHNTATLGGGVYIMNGGYGIVGGSIKIKDNTGGNLVTSNNLFVGTDASAPVNGMQVYVTKLDGSSASTKGQFTDNCDKSSYTIFYSDDNKYSVKYNKNDGYYELIEPINVCKNVQTTKVYETLEAAIAEVAASQTIQMLANAEADGQIELSGKSFALDLNGKDISAADGCRLFYIKNDAGLTITDSFVPEEKEEGGHINGSEITTDAFDGSIIYNFGTLTVSGGIFQHAISSGAGSDGAITNGQGSTFSMTGGIVRNCASNGGFGGAVVIQKDNTSAEISGGKFYENSSLLGGAIAIEAAGQSGNNGKLTISGGEIFNNSTTGDIASLQNIGGAIGNEGDLIITGGYFHNNTAFLAGGIGNMGNLTIGGTVKITGNTANETTSNLTNAYGCNITIGTPAEGMSVGVTKLNNKFEVTSGQFTNNGASTDAKYFFSDIDAYSVAYKAGSGEGGYLELVGAPNVCMIVETKAEYQSIPLAIAAVKEEETIKMLKDINITSTIVVPAGTPAFKLDLDGYVLKQTGSGSVMEIRGAEQGDIEILDAANVTIKDSKYGDTTYPHYFDKTENTWSITATVNDNVVYGGVITGGNSVGGAIYNRGALIITNGNFCGNSSDGDGGAIAHGSDLTTIINGGSFCYNYAKGKGGAVVGLGSSKELLTITGGEFKYNTAGAFGGAVATSTLISVSGGTFSNNTAGQCGGGLALEDEAIATITGGTFSNNAAYVGGGIGNLSPKTTIGGKLVVTGNKGVQMGPGYVSPDSNFGTTVPIIIGTEKYVPAETMKIGIYLGNDDTELNPPYPPKAGQFTTNGTAEDVKYFTSDVNTYSVAYNKGSEKGGYLELVEGTGPTAFDLEITDAGYASLYYDHNLVVPNAKIRVFTYSYDVANNALVPKNVLETGAIIPAETGVIVFGAKGTYSFDITDGEPTTDVSSVLTGVLEETAVEKIEGTIYAYGQPADPNYKPAFYMISDKVKTVPAYKAYYIKSEKKKDTEAKSIMIKED